MASHRHISSLSINVDGEETFLFGQFQHSPKPRIPTVEHRMELCGPPGPKNRNSLWLGLLQSSSSIRHGPPIKLNWHVWLGLPGPRQWSRILESELRKCVRVWTLPPVEMSKCRSLNESCNRGFNLPCERTPAAINFEWKRTETQDDDEGCT